MRTKIQELFVQALKACEEVDGHRWCSGEEWWRSPKYLSRDIGFIIHNDLFGYSAFLVRYLDNSDFSSPLGTESKWNTNILNFGGKILRRNKDVMKIFNRIKSKVKERKTEEFQNSQQSLKNQVEQELVKLISEFEKRNK